MFSTDTWIKIFCGMMTNTVLFGVGAVTALSIPALQPHLGYVIPAVVVASFALSPFPASWIANRMRIRNWGRRAWRQGDLISG